MPDRIFKRGGPNQPSQGNSENVVDQSSPGTMPVDEKYTQTRDLLAKGLTIWNKNGYAGPFDNWQQADQAMRDLLYGPYDNEKNIPKI